MWIEQRQGTIKRQRARAVDSTMSGGTAGKAALKPLIDSMGRLESETEQIEAYLAEPADCATSVTLHPKVIERHLTSLERPSATVRDPASLGDGSIAAMFRQFIERVIVHPVPPRALPDAEIVGRLSELLAAPELPPSARFGGGCGGSGGGT